MSPQYWADMEKRLPRKVRMEFAPVAQHAREIAEYEARRPAIEAAHGALMAAQSTTPAAENHFLTVLCATSFVQVTRGMEEESAP